MHPLAKRTNGARMQIGDFEIDNAAWGAVQLN